MARLDEPGTQGGVEFVIRLLVVGVCSGAETCSYAPSKGTPVLFTWFGELGSAEVGYGVRGLLARILRGVSSGLTVHRDQLCQRW